MRARAPATGGVRRGQVGQGMLVELAFVAIGAFFGGIVTGAAGFAFAIVAGAFWVHVLPPTHFVLLAAACATLLHASAVWQFRAKIDWRALSPFLIGGFVGAPLGVLALSKVDVDSFRILIGVAIVVYAGYLALSPRIGHVTVPDKATRWVDAVVGWISGIIGGLTMLHGILPTIWCAARGFDKWRSRLIYQPYILFTGLYVMLMVGLKVGGDMTRLVTYFLVSLPALFAGMGIGSRIFGRLSEQLFRRILLTLLFISGIVMLV